MRMPFGRFRGIEIADLEDGYLQWLHDHVQLREPLRFSVEAEYKLRFDTASADEPLPENVQQMAAELVSLGYRKLAQIHHPDHGGDTHAMQLLNEAAQFLRRMVRRER